MIIDNMTIYDDYIDQLIDQFKIDYNFNNILDIPQNTFTALLKYIYIHTFKIDNSFLLNDKHNSYDYNIDHVYLILEKYIYLCNMYNKIPSVIGFTSLTGINNDTIYEWYKKPSIKHNDVFKIIKQLRLDSLTGKLADGKQNPVGTIAILNNEFNWSTSNSSTEQTKRAALTAAELPKLDAITGPVVADQE